MNDFIATFGSSDANHILSGVSLLAAVAYEIYLRSVTRRIRHVSILGAELDAFFKKLQAKWAASSTRIEER
jgi:hypothetical protein